MQTRQTQVNDPAADEVPAAAVEILAGKAGGKQGVLVVDGEHQVRIMVQLWFERNGYDVWSARGGLEAIDLYRLYRARIVIVLLEVYMPGLDGIQTLRAIREVNPDILACFMGDDTVACELEELLRCGGAYYIAKPFRLEDLANFLPAEKGEICSSAWESKRKSQN